MFTPTLCDRTLGASGGVAAAGRDWDLSTPGPWAATASPSLSLTCERRFAGAGVSWLGVDIAPLHLHTYRALDQRLPLWHLVDYGLGRRVGARTLVGVDLLTNGLAFGVGARLHTSYRPGGTLRPGPDVKVRVLFGNEPEAMVVVGWRSSGRIRETLPEPDQEERVHARWGMEIGTITGLRARVGQGDWAGVARLGTYTALRRGAALRPTALLGVEAPVGDTFHALVGAGAQRVDDVWQPLGSIAMTTQGRLMRAHFGGLIRTDGTVQPDFGFAWTW